MQRKIALATFNLLTVLLFCACNGPRYIYSSSPLVSPVASAKNATSINASYFSHNKSVNTFDTPANKDNAFGFDISHMVTKKIKLVALADVKNEKNWFRLLTDSARISIYNGGFDSSAVITNRSAFGLGMVYFFDPLGRRERIVPSIAGSLYMHQMKMKESGILRNNEYDRFFNASQLSLAIQYNLLFKLGKRFNIAYIARLTLVKFLAARTDFTKGEKDIAGLHSDGKLNLFPSFLSGYADYKPLRNVPLYLNFQFFNDVALWNKVMAKYDPPRTNIKGSGFAIGVHYTFQ